MTTNSSAIEIKPTDGNEWEAQDGSTGATGCYDITANGRQLARLIVHYDPKIGDPDDARPWADIDILPGKDSEAWGLIFSKGSRVARVEVPAVVALDIRLEPQDEDEPDLDPEPDPQWDPVERAAPHRNDPAADVGPAFHELLNAGAERRRQRKQDQDALPGRLTERATSPYNVRGDLRAEPHTPKAADWPEKTGTEGRRHQALVDLTRTSAALTSHLDRELDLEARHQAVAKRQRQRAEAAHSQAIEDACDAQDLIGEDELEQSALSLGGVPQ